MPENFILMGSSQPLFRLKGWRHVAAAPCRQPGAPVSDVCTFVTQLESVKKAGAKQKDDLLAEVAQLKAQLRSLPDQEGKDAACLEASAGEAEPSAALQECVAALEAELASKHAELTDMQVGGYHRRWPRARYACGLD